MPLVRKSTFRIFRKSKILSEEIFAQITDRDCIPPDRLFSSRTTSSKSAPRSALQGRKFCSRIPQRQSRLLIFSRDFLSSYQGGSLFFGNVFLREGISAIHRQLVSSQIIIFARSKINASRYACCLNFFARKCESAKTKPTAPFVVLTGFCRGLFSLLIFPSVKP